MKTAISGSGSSFPGGSVFSIIFIFQGQTELGVGSFCFRQIRTQGPGLVRSKILVGWSTRHMYATAFSNKYSWSEDEIKAPGEPFGLWVQVDNGDMAHQPNSPQVFGGLSEHFEP